MENLTRFHSKIVECDYASNNFNRYLNHTWDKHSLNVGFSYKCDVSDCTSQYKNVQSFWRHLKTKDCWFYEKYVKRYENHSNRYREIDLDEKFDNENVFNDNDMKQFWNEHEGQVPDHIENISFADWDHNQLIACFLSELRQKNDTITDFMFCQWNSITCFTVGKQCKIRNVSGEY